MQESGEERTGLDQQQSQPRRNLIEVWFAVMFTVVGALVLIRSVLSFYNYQLVVHHRDASFQDSDGTSLVIQGFE